MGGGGRNCSPGAKLATGQATSLFKLRSGLATPRPGGLDTNRNPAICSSSNSSTSSSIRSSSNSNSNSRSSSRGYTPSLLCLYADLPVRLPKCVRFCDFVCARLCYHVRPCASACLPLPACRCRGRRVGGAGRGLRTVWRSRAAAWGGSQQGSPALGWEASGSGPGAGAIAECRAGRTGRACSLGGRSFAGAWI